MFTVEVVEWLLIGFGRRPEVVKGLKQEWAMLASIFKEFWPAYKDSKAPSHNGKYTSNLPLLLVCLGLC